MVCDLAIIFQGLRHGRAPLRAPRIAFPAIEPRDDHHLIPFEPRDATTADLCDSGRGALLDRSAPRRPFGIDADRLRAPRLGIDTHIEGAFADADALRIEPAKAGAGRVAPGQQKQRGDKVQ